MNTSFFSKRIGRLEFLVYLFSFYVLISLVGLLETVLYSKLQIQIPFVILKMASYLTYVWFLWFIILSIKRLHDIDLSGFYVFIPIILILLIGFITLGFGAILGVFASAVYLGIKKGTIGSNRFGEDTLLK